MSTLRETPGNKTIRLGLEAQIDEYFKADDMTQVNKYLDVYPHNKVRAEVSLEQAHHIATAGLGEVLELKAAA